MPVSSIKGCWSKFSARIRDYIEGFDAYLGPNGEIASSVGGDHGGHNEQTCDYKSPSHTTTNREKRSHHRISTGNHHRHQHDQNCLSVERAIRHIAVQQNYPSYTSGIDNITGRSAQFSYTKRKTAQGQVYFVDTNGHKYWHDPSVPKDLLNAQLNLDLLVGRLSNNWEVSHTSSGKTYYINHTKKTTQFTDPRLIAYKDVLVNYLRQRASSNGPTPLTNSQEPSQDYSQRSRVSRSNQPKDVGRDHQHHRQHPSSGTRNSTSHVNSIRQAALNDSTAIDHELHSGTLDNRGHRYQMNLLRGSQQNLPSATAGAGHSNTLTGPIPDWFKNTTLRKYFQDNNRLNSANNVTSRDDTFSDNQPPTNLTQLPNTLDAPNNHDIDQLSQSLIASTQLTTFDTSQYTEVNNKELYDKISILRQELLKQQVLTHPCRIDINRKRIFEESYRAVSQMQSRDLKKRLLIKFRGEEGLDYGGVAREWFYLLSREILNPVHGLFQYTSDDNYCLQINPDSGIVYREHLSYLNFCGRVIGMAVFHGHFIEGRFTLPFYKMLLRKPISLKDIEFVDPDLYRSLCWILDNDITDVIDTTFLVQHNAFGQLQEHELRENGRNTVVTEANKHEYVSLYVNYRCRRGIENQFEALQRGFHELISASLVEQFDEYELELLIGGLSKINVDDWRLHTKLKNCTTESPLVVWFWDIVKSYDEKKRARLLQFVTGSPRVPIQGFKALQGVNSELRLFTIHLIKNACTDNLPKSHTCFNRIDLPPYETYEKLRDKLTQAIEETIGFAMQ